MEQSPSIAAWQESPEGDIYSLSYEPLDIQAVITAVRDDAAGAIASFIGTTRDNFQGKKVVRLEYEAYTKLAMNTLRVILSRARRDNMGLVRIAVHHRLGVVETGDPSIIIAVSSVHRKEALAACEQILEDIKLRAQIFKMEVYEGEDIGLWKENFPTDKNPQ